MTLPAEVAAACRKVFSEAGLETGEITAVRTVSGGCINTCVQLETSGGDYFVKWNRKDAYPGMFEAEAKGLRLLESAGAIRVPQVIGNQSEGNTDVLVLEWIESGRRKPDFFEQFGMALAKQHSHTTGKFGLDHDNYIGSLPQRNTPTASWEKFFIDHRITPQLKKARDGNYLETGDVKSTERLFGILNEIFPKAKPALLHGDLWSGNFLVGPSGEPCIVDPAVYYGHPEMELAFTKLFGGYDRSFYDGYDSEGGIEPGFEHRVDVYNLYPLLVHVNLFGQGYVGQVRQILRRF